MGLGRLHVCPFLGTWHALLCGEVFVGALDEASANFLWMDDLRSPTCRKCTDKSFTPCVLRSIAVSPQPGCFENVMLSRTAQGYQSKGVNGCQRTPGSEELDDRELNGALSAIWSREDPRFPGHRQHRHRIFQHVLQVWYYADFKEKV